MALPFIRNLLGHFIYTQNTIRYRVEWRRMREALKRIGPVDHLFDGGAGSGEFARKELAEGWCKKVTALEFDPNNFRILNSKLGNRENVTLKAGSLLEVPFEDSSFDLVQCTQVLEHIEDHERAASELIRVLKPGGHALITVPHPPEPFPNEGHVREGYTEDDLEKLFAAVGCRKVHTDFFITRPTLDRMLKVEGLPGKGVYVPIQWIDCEAGTTFEQRRGQRPFGILMLFQKDAQQ
jgi:SAM-dependent methyltransferase